MSSQLTPRGRGALRATGLLCALGAVAMFSGGLRRAADPAAAADITPAAQTALWSPRRVPNLFDNAAAVVARARAAAGLTNQLATIVAPYNACVAVDGAGRPIVRVGGTVARAPASTLKLLTAIVALHTLGPTHRFATRVVRDSAGNLVVVGGGDPLLATPEFITHRHSQVRFRDAEYTPLTALADAIVAAGVRRVPGALVVDDHLHSTLRFLPDWKPSYATEGDVGALGALTVDGGFADSSALVAASDPAMTAGQRLRDLLTERGVVVTGGVQRGRAPANGVEIAHVDSLPLATIVGEMLRPSDDSTAEALLRDIAVGDAGNQPATTELGTRVLLRDMARLGIPPDGVVLRDGSGLAPTDRISCPALLRIVELSTETRFAAIDRGLAVAGRTGTLATRFLGRALEGRLRAKTGSIDGVVGLAGVIDGPRPFRFAFLANGQFSVAEGAALQAAIAEAIDAVPDPGAPAGLVPAP